MPNQPSRVRQALERRKPIWLGRISQPGSRSSTRCQRAGTGGLERRKETLAEAESGNGRESQALPVAWTRGGCQSYAAGSRKRNGGGDLPAARDLLERAYGPGSGICSGPTSNPGVSGQAAGKPGGSADCVPIRPKTLDPSIQLAAGLIDQSFVSP